MRIAPVLAICVSLTGAAFAQTSSPSATPATTTGQSTAGSSITTQTAPAPLNTTPPINPAPQSSSPLLTNTPQPNVRKRTHNVMGTSNTYQNGANGSVQSDAVANGTAPISPPTTNSAPPNSGTSSINGPSTAPGTVAQPTPRAPQ